MSPTKLDVVVVDDQPLELNGIIATLTACPDLTVTGAFRSHAELQAAGCCGTAALLVSAIRIHGQPCLDSLRRLQAQYPQLKVVAIAGSDEHDLLRQVADFGFDGLALKSGPVDELVQAVRTAAQGGQYISPDAKALLADVRAGADASPGAAEAVLCRLTPRERQILKLVCSGLSARKIAEELAISVWTVTNHKSNIMGKLGIRNQVGLTRFAIGAGLVVAGSLDGL